MVIGSDWFQLFSPKSVPPNIKLRLPMILSNPIFEFCVKWCQIWLFSSVFFCCPNALKGNKRVYQTFVIATLFWEKWCIFGKSSRCASTFVHDCISSVKSNKKWSQWSLILNTLFHFLSAPLNVLLWHLLLEVYYWCRYWESKLWKN